jgi:membrane protease YdiL (CAAX protease family)
MTQGLGIALPEGILGRRPWLALGVGSAGGLFLVGLSEVLILGTPWAKNIEVEFARFMSDQRGWEIVVLSVLSAVGEELFFRGAVQGALGVAAATIIFGVVHWPVTSKLVAWPLFATGAGALMGVQAIWMDGLVAPIMTHFLVNLVRFWRIRSKYGTRTEV